jgi:hypothetical protein
VSPTIPSRESPPTADLYTDSEYGILSMLPESRVRMLPESKNHDEGTIEEWQRDL